MPRSRFADRLIPSWSFRVLGGFALCLAIALPAAAMRLGWLDDEPPVVEGELGQAARPRLVRLPSGTFQMGSADDVGESDEHPQHVVTVSPFALCETEVTVAQYRLVTGEEPSDCRFGCEDEHPVHDVSWEDAIAYLNELTRLENLGRVEAGLPELTPCYDERSFAWDRGCSGYRLPTEAEWEYAARAGSTTAYSFGDDLEQLCEYAQVSECGGAGVVGVKDKRANVWGLYAMHGNVWEWVFDRYDPNYYETSPTTDPANDNDNDTETPFAGCCAAVPS